MEDLHHKIPGVRVAYLQKDSCKNDCRACLEQITKEFVSLVHSLLRNDTHALHSNYLKGTAGCHCCQLCLPVLDPVGFQCLENTIYCIIFDSSKIV